MAFVADDPKLAPLWDAGQNPQPASKVDARSFRAAVWRCVNGHTFQRSPRAMQNDQGCPTCSKGANTHTNLGKLRPGLASQWDADKNVGIAFATLDATHASAVWWRCSNGHSFQRPPVRMLSEDTCPTCALAKTSLAALAPNVAAEWHATKNAIRPDEIAADHVMNAWWTCAPTGTSTRRRFGAHAGQSALPDLLRRLVAREHPRVREGAGRPPRISSTRASCSRWRCKPACSRTRASRS
jgi:hypothetical protein